MSSITIIGCGWFGLPLAKKLVSLGLTVKATKRSTEDLVLLREADIEAFQLDLDHIDDTVDYQPLFDSDAIVINLPPGLRRGDSHYIRHLTSLRHLMGTHDYQRVIFISTTGVYPSLDSIVTEQDAQAVDDISATLLQAEGVFAQLPNSCIVRFSGLVGPKRHPGRFFAGKTDVSGANVAVNLVHLDDCIAAVCLLLTRAHCQPIYNLAAEEHPTRGEFYVAAAEHLGLTRPVFNQQRQLSKIIDGQLICADVGFSYLYSNPLKMLDAC
jgi:nucleoside-diphosphate-sugar epimerase